MVLLSPEAFEEMQSRLDILIELRDDVFDEFFRDNSIVPEEQIVLDRIDGKILKLQLYLKRSLNEDGGPSSSISAPVGRGGKNVPEDVRLVQELLNENGYRLVVNGICGPKTIAAIKLFQTESFGWNDSLVEPHKQTITALTGGHVSGSPTESSPTDQGSDLSITGPSTDTQGTPDVDSSPSDRDDETSDAQDDAGENRQSPETGDERGRDGTDSATPETPEEREAPEEPEAPDSSEAPGGGQPEQDSSGVPDNTNQPSLPDGVPEPRIIEDDPNDENVVERLLEDILEGLPTPVTGVDFADENGEVLSLVEYPFVRNQEFSIGIKMGHLVQGELKIKFNERGQLESVTVSRSILPGASFGAGEGIFARGSIKPLAYNLKLSRTNSELVFELEIAAKGAIMVGLGAAYGGPWAGLGGEVELKMGRIETLATSLGIDTLAQIARGIIPATGVFLEFDLPMTFTMRGSVKLVLGAGTEEYLTGHAMHLASKITLKEYDPMITVQFGPGMRLEVVAHEGLQEMFVDWLRIAPLTMHIMLARELHLEIMEFLDDPEAYQEESRQTRDDLLRRARELPNDVSDFMNDEIDKLETFFPDEVRQGRELAVDVMVTTLDAVEFIGNTGEDILENVDEEINDNMELVESIIEEARETSQQIREVVDDTVEDVEEIVENAREEVVELVGDLHEEVDDLMDGVGEARDGAMELFDDLVGNSSGRSSPKRKKRE